VYLLTLCSDNVVTYRLLVSDLLLFIIIPSIRTFVPANSKHIIVQASQKAESEQEMRRLHQEKEVVSSMLYFYLSFLSDDV
jgi:hypothetical protein